MKKHHRILVTAVTTALLSPVVAMATNGYQLIGVGSYQKSLAGAVTANPGSAMAAVSNPAGAARVGARADFSMEAFMPDRSVDFLSMGGDTADSAVEMYGVPAIGWTAPTSDGSNLYFGGGMYGTSGMGVDYAPTVMSVGMDMAPGGGDDIYWDGYSNIAFWQMAPVLAWNVDEKLSLGGSLNIDYQSVAFKQRVMQDTDDDGVGDFVVNNFDLSRSASGFGLGLSLGLLYDLTDNLTIGASYKSKQEFSDLEYQLAAGDITNMGTPLPAGTYKLDLDFPQQAAVGVAFRPTSQWTISADLKWINWSQTMDKLAVNGPPGIKVNMDPGWKDQTVYALGVAYAVNEKVNLRAGYNFASTPFDEDKVSSNLILPAIVESHYTLGADFRLNNRWDLGFHYMVVPEKTMTAPATDAMAPGAEISLSETSFGANIGYRF
jgi:long-chain fatty acid transport protein